MGEELAIDYSLQIDAFPGTSNDEPSQRQPGGGSMLDRAGVPSLTTLDGVAHVEYVVRFYYGQLWLPSVGVR